MKRKIILSLTSALDSIAAEVLKEDDLKSAIFSLDCTRVILDMKPKELLACKAEGPVTLEHIKRFMAHFRRAVAGGRVVWRYDKKGNEMKPSDVQSGISSVLSRFRLQPLNPNLPPVVDNDFLKIAIERVNNKDGLETVQVIW